MKTNQWLDLFACTTLTSLSKIIVVQVPKEFPILWNGLLIQHWRSKSITPSLIDLAQISISEFKLQLAQQGFLSQNTLFMVRGFDEISPTAQADLREYIAVYDQTNLLLYTSQELHINHSSVAYYSVSTIISLADFKRLASSVGLHNFLFDRMSIVLQQKKINVTVDTASLLLHYTKVLSNQTFDLFMEQWFDQLVHPEESLFNMSTSFFARDKEFFAQWVRVCWHYNSAFWIVFWSDQIWRAALYCRYKQAGNHAEAKKVSVRLPFSFINRDWRKYTFTELQKMHHALFEVDQALKNGIHATALDTWLSRFFLYG